MHTVNILISGIYNPQMIQYLKQFGVNQFSFDCRPKSFNFIQAYKIKEMLIAHGSVLDQYFLHFEDEKDFVIFETLKDITSVPSDHGSLNLEFSGKESLSFYEQFEIPYTWHFNELVSIDSLPNLKYLRGISFNQIFLERLYQFRELFNFLGKIQENLSENQFLQLKSDWGEPMFESVIDFFTFKTLSLEINNKVEISYRNPDLNLVSNHIEHTKHSFSL